MNLKETNFLQKVIWTERIKQNYLKKTMVPIYSNCHKDQPSKRYTIWKHLTIIAYRDSILQNSHPYTINDLIIWLNFKKKECPNRWRLGNYSDPERPQQRTISSIFRLITCLHVLKFPKALITEEINKLFATESFKRNIRDAEKVVQKMTYST